METWNKSLQFVSIRYLQLPPLDLPYLSSFDPAPICQPTTGMGSSHSKEKKYPKAEHRMGSPSIRRSSSVKDRMKTSKDYRKLDSEVDLVINEDNRKEDGGRKSRRKVQKRKKQESRYATHCHSSLSYC